jgi:DNA repair exonuclease SbcCD ATPase subunit
VTTNKKIAGVEQRIAKLESACASLREQISQAVEPGQKDKWQEAFDSIEEELTSLRKLNAEKQGGAREPVLKTLLKNLEDAEKVVFRAFVLGTTIIGAGTLLSHEIAPLVNLIEHPTEQQEKLDTHGKRTQSLGSGTEPMSESLRKLQEEHTAEFRELTGTLGGLCVYPSLQESATEWLTLDKISEPNSIACFIETLRTAPTKSPVQGGAPQTFNPLGRTQKF